MSEFIVDWSKLAAQSKGFSLSLARNGKQCHFFKF